MRAICIKTEHDRTSGIDIAIRIEWNCEGGARQTAYDHRQKQTEIVQRLEISPVR